AIQVNPNGGFDVIGSHAFGEEGMTTVTVTIQDLGGSNTITKAISTAVTDDAPLTATGLIATATEGVSFTGAVASFSDADAFAFPGDYVVGTDWGDVSSVPGTGVDKRSV